MTIFKHVMLRVIIQVRDRDDMSTPQLRLHTHSLKYHIFAKVVSRCLPCCFHLPQCPSMVGPPYLHRLSSDLKVFSQQPASNAASMCLACETPQGYSYLVAAPW